MSWPINKRGIWKMLINVKYLGVGSINKDAQQVEVPAGLTVEDLVRLLQDKLEMPVEMLLKSAVFMVNNSKVDLGFSLKEGDEVLILRPLGGG